MWVISLVLSLTCCGGHEGSDEGSRDFSQHVAVISLLEIDPIRLLREGFAERLAEHGSATGESIVLKYYNAGNDSSVLASIVSRVQRSEPLAVYALGTPVSQALQSQAPSVLVVQGAATDPVAAGLADSWEASGRRYIATSDTPTLEPLLDYCQLAFGDLTLVAVPFNPSESNSVAILNMIRAQAAKRKFALKEVAVSGAAEYLAVSSRITSGDVDLILVPPDNTVFAFIEALSREAAAKGIPVAATTEDALDSGAVVSLGIDYHRLGRASAEMLLEVIQGASPESMAIRPAPSPSVLVRRSALIELGASEQALQDRAGVEFRQ